MSPRRLDSFVEAVVGYGLAVGSVLIATLFIGVLVFSIFRLVSMAVTP